MGQRDLVGEVTPRRVLIAALLLLAGSPALAHSASVSPPHQIATVAVPITFTDDPLQAGITAIRAIHITELRSYIDAMRSRYSLADYAWTDLAGTSGVTVLKSAYVTELRAALQPVYAAAGRPVPTYSDPELTAGIVALKAVHLTEIRAAIVAFNSRVIGLSGNLSFGNIPVGSTASTTLTMSNTGLATLTVSGITYPSGFAGNYAGGSIAPGGAQTVTVTFSPTAATAYSGTITVNSDATSGTDTAVVSGAGTAAPDTTAPTFVSVGFSPATVDVSVASATVTATFHLTDTGTGVQGFTLELSGPAGVNAHGSAPTLISGTRTDGVWTCSITIPIGSTPGVWPFTGAMAFDGAGNQGVVSGAAAAQLSSGITVINTTPDTTAPTFVSVSFSPTTVDTTTVAATVTATLHLTDAGTGVLGFSITMTGPAGIKASCGAPTLKSGTSTDGVWTCSLTIPVGSAPGAWPFTGAAADDFAGNHRDVSGAAAAQLSSGIIVTNAAPDTTAPMFVSVSFSPAAVNVATAAATVTATVHVTDTGTGVQGFTLSLSGPTGIHAFCGAPTLSSGTSADGVWTCSITIPVGSAAGAWPLTDAMAFDVAGNHRVVSGAAAAQLSSGITVTNTATETAAPTLGAVQNRTR